MNCEITNKRTNDRVNWAGGLLFWVTLGSMVGLLFARGVQEYKKHTNKSRFPATQVIQSVQKDR